MYKHTQIGWVIIIFLGSACLLILLESLYENTAVDTLPTFIVFILMLAFASLTVTVTTDYINAVFGIGLIRKRIKISEIVSLKIVRNKWWQGFGIHGWWGKGWLLNVSGLNAVELKMKNGMIYKIGTDDPQKLHDAIQAKIH